MSVSLAKHIRACGQDGHLEFAGPIVRADAHTVTIHATRITGIYTRTAYPAGFDVTLPKINCDLYTR